MVTKVRTKGQKRRKYQVIGIALPTYTPFFFVKNFHRLTIGSEEAQIS
jgi:hypothetical protein